MRNSRNQPVAATTGRRDKAMATEQGDGGKLFRQDDRTHYIRNSRVIHRMLRRSTALHSLTLRSFCSRDRMHQDTARLAEREIRRFRPPCSHTSIPPKRSTRRDTGHCKHGNAQFFNDFTATPAGCFRSAFPQTWPPAPARASVCRTPKFPAHRRLRNFYYLYPIENSKQRALGMQYPVSVRPTHPPNREKPRIADLPERTSASSRRDGNAHEAIYRK